MSPKRLFDTTNAEIYVALLRGINVGGHNKVPMADLRSLCSDFGWVNARTYIQSGNVVFAATARPAKLEAEFEGAIRRNFRLEIPVVVRSKPDWLTTMASNPYTSASATEPNLVMLALCKDPLLPGVADSLCKYAANGERIRQAGNALWIHYPGGSGRSKLSPSVLDRAAGSPVTARNWRTVTRIRELTDEP